MIKTVCREHHWTPTDIDELFTDDQDFRGLEFWYQDVKECHDELNKKNNGRS
tara:strand:- start:932 stop:1087 length:156 start_codon:yes stop_codon:yes gene_type:complete